MNLIKDELSGNSYHSEKAMYMRYHGLTEDQADLVMSAQSHNERDQIFNSILASRHSH